LERIKNIRLPLASLRYNARQPQSDGRTETRGRALWVTIDREPKRDAMNKAVLV
jgi:hypothetical protein